MVWVELEIVRVSVFPVWVELDSDGVFTVFAARFGWSVLFSLASCFHTASLHILRNLFCLCGDAYVFVCTYTHACVGVFVCVAGGSHTGCGGLSALQTENKTPVVSQRAPFIRALHPAGGRSPNCVLTTIVT